MTAPAINPPNLNPAFIPIQDLPGRWVCLLWHETATEFQDGHVEVYRSIQTHQIFAGDLGKLFQSIRDHAGDIHSA